MSVDDFSLKITIFESLDSDKEKSDAKYWRGEIQKWNKFFKRRSL